MKTFIKSVKCLICERDLEIEAHAEGADHELVMDAGFVYVEFHYGSTLDQCKGHPNPHSLYNERTHLTRLLCSDQIEGYICDECFKKKQHLFRGFMSRKKTVRTETTDAPACRDRDGVEERLGDDEARPDNSAALHGDA